MATASAGRSARHQGRAPGTIPRGHHGRLHNAFNVAPVLTYTTTYGPAWLTPQTFLQSAFVKLGGRFTF
jgi:hypothetical protein